MTTLNYIADNCERLDILCSSAFNMSRSKVANLIKNGQCHVNQQNITKPSWEVKYGDNINLTVPESEPSELVAENIPISILFEDDDIVVLNKQSGIVVHPGNGNTNGTLVNALLYHIHDLSGINGKVRPGIVHRLDKDTSGIIIIAKNDNAHIIISEQIKNRAIEKYYIAAVLGKMKEKIGTIIKPIARHKIDRKKMTIDENGKYAETRWKCLGESKNTSLLLLRIITGRTHQIRVHLSSISRPVVGDKIYNKQESKHDFRLMLHAYHIKFTHPTTNKTLSITAPLPKDFLKSANKLSYTEEILNSIFNNLKYDL